MWFWYGVASAVVGAVSITVNKALLKKVNASVLTGALLAFQLPVDAYLAFRTGVVSVNWKFFGAILVSSLAFSVAKTMSMSSIKHGLLSKVFPLMAMSSIYTYLFGLIFLHEVIKPGFLVGLGAIVVGSYVLNAERMKEGLWLPFKTLLSHRASRLYLIAAVAFGLSAVMDKISLVNVAPQNPFMTLLAGNMLVTTFIGMYLVRRIKNWKTQLKNNFWGLLLASLVYMVLGVIVYLGFYDGPVALVVGIKKLQIIFVLLLSWVFFGDKPSRFSWVGTVLMLLGVMMFRVF